MRNLKIEYNGIVLFDGEVSELQWSDSDAGVTVHGKAKRAAAQKLSGAGILDMITNASKQKTASMIEEKREALVEEKQKEVVDIGSKSELD